MADDNDSLLREVDEELRREQMQKLWQRYNGVILAGNSLATTVAAELAPLLARTPPNTAADADERATALRVLLGEISRLQRAGIITINRSCTTCHHYQPSVTGADHCLLLDQPLADADLRLDCPDHRVAADVTEAAQQPHR